MSIIKILPPSAGPLERDFVRLIQRVFDALLWTPPLFTDTNGNTVTTPAGVPIRYLWDPWRCPREFLPFLASALSVNPLIFNFSEDKQRAYIANSIPFHKQKGTHQSLYDVAKLLRFDIKPNGIHFPFMGNQDANDDDLNRWMEFTIDFKNLIPNSLVAPLKELLEETIPVRCRLIAINYGILLKWNGVIPPQGGPSKFNATYKFGEVNI